MKGGGGSRRETTQLVAVPPRAICHDTTRNSFGSAVARAPPPAREHRDLHRVTNNAVVGRSREPVVSSSVSRSRFRLRSVSFGCCNPAFRSVVAAVLLSAGLMVGQTKNSRVARDARLIRSETGISGIRVQLKCNLVSYYFSEMMA